MEGIKICAVSSSPLSLSLYLRLSLSLSLYLRLSLSLSLSPPSLPLSPSLSLYLRLSPSISLSLRLSLSLPLSPSFSVSLPLSLSPLMWRTVHRWKNPPSITELKGIQNHKHTHSHFIDYIWGFFIPWKPSDSWCACAAFGVSAYTSFNRVCSLWMFLPYSLLWMISLSLTGVRVWDLNYIQCFQNFQNFRL